MSLELKKAAPQELRTLGLDERWLQDRISNDPSLLGLGQLEIASREHRQPVGGRIDFLMRDAESGEYYEVEIMLGKLDESHIIRTIEYWDLERQRRPKSKHRAVIVAEHITSRFFNVLRLLNRAVPMIAVQLSAFPVDGGVVLHPVTVLDVVEEANSDVVDEVEKADRAYWVKNSDPTFLAIVDKIISIFRAEGTEPRVAYNRGHIALGTEGYNFCWFVPRKSVGHCRIEFRTTEETRDSLLSSLQTGGIDATPADTTEYIRFNITTNLLEEHFALISEALKRAEELSRH
jgi:hypothetical protein